MTELLLSSFSDMLSSVFYFVLLQSAFERAESFIICCNAVDVSYFDEASNMYNLAH